MSLNKRLKDLRLKRGISISDLSFRTGICRSTLNDMENGRKVQGEPYNRLCEELECSLEYLLYGNKNEKDHILKDLEQLEKSIKQIKRMLIRSQSHSKK